MALAGANAGAIIGTLHGVARVGAGASLLVGIAVLIAALATALRGAVMQSATIEVSAREVANFASPPFTDEPDLWRIHLRTVRGLLVSIDLTSRQGDRAARAVMTAGRLFLVGLFAVGGALGILILVVTF